MSEIEAHAASDEGGKALVRKTVSSVMRRQSRRELERWGKLAERRVIRWPTYRFAKVILVYHAIGEELDTNGVLRDAIHVGKTVCLPRIDWQSKAMTPALVTSLDSLITKRHGILEPPDDAPAIPIEDLDLILVPGVAFDERCNRLGRGGGFYDRFLAAIPPTTTLCGVGFEVQVIHSVPMESHDRPLDAVATESRLILRS